MPAPYGPGASRIVFSSWRDDVYRRWPVNMADPTHDGGAVVIGPRPLSALHDTLNQHVAARILSGMDASATNVPQLLQAAAVQRLVEGTVNALFSSEKAYTGQLFESDFAIHRLLHHNGGGAGVSSIAGIYLPVPPSVAPSMCIAYIENWDNPLQGSWGRPMLDELRGFTFPFHRPPDPRCASPTSRTGTTPPAGHLGPRDAR